MWTIWVYPIYVKTHILYTQSFSITTSIRLNTLAHMLNGYEMSQYNKLFDFQYAKF